MKKIIFLLQSIICFAVISVAQPTQPSAPISCNANNCQTSAGIDVCAPGTNTIVSDFRNKFLQTNAGNSGLSAGSEWRFRSIAVGNGITTNAIVKIVAISNAVLNNVDDDAATDQDGNSIVSFFAPRIGPDQNLNGTDRRGYVEFQISFVKNPTGTNNNTNADFASVSPLTDLNYVHYDIDGSNANNTNPSGGTPGSWFRETGLAKRINASNPQVIADANTELVSYNYTDPISVGWTGFAGTVCERTGVSKCSQTAASFKYLGSVSGISIRMGYDYNAGGNVGAPVRQYGSRFGCFDFPQQSTLPVRLLSFTGNYNDGKVLLNWEADNQIDFDHYEIERSFNGRDFTSIGTRVPQNSGALKEKFQFGDDITNINGANFYYRLKMVDVSGLARYSNVVIISKVNKSITGITMMPNPVYGGVANIKMSSSVNGVAEVRVVDLSGKIILRQQNTIYKGTNTLAINNISKLQPGIYTLQVVNDDDISVTKFSVLK